MPAQLHKALWAAQFYFLQLYCGAAFSVLCWAFWDPRAGWSALLGTMVYGLAQGVFVWMAFRHRGARQAKHIAAAFYRGECCKLMLLAMLGWRCVTWFSPSMLPFVLALMVLQSVYFWAPLWLRT